MKKSKDEGKNLFENQLQMRASNSHNRGDVGADWKPGLLNDRDSPDVHGNGGMMQTADQIQQLNEQINRLSGTGMRS